MRLDKYLKTARILKRRTVSKELADQQRVYVNGRVAKPSTEVKPGDEIRVLFGYRELTVRVLQTPKQVSTPVLPAVLQQSESAPHPFMKFYIKVPFEVREGDILRGASV